MLRTQYFSHALEWTCCSLLAVHIGIKQFKRRLVLCAEVESLFWMKIVRGCQLSVRRKEGSSVNFLGFREKVRTCAGVCMLVVEEHARIRLEQKCAVRSLAPPPGTASLLRTQVLLSSSLRWI